MHRFSPQTVLGDLKGPQLSLLLSLAMHGDQAQVELGAHTGWSKHTLERALRELEAQQMVERVHYRLWTLAPAGRAVIDAVVDAAGGEEAAGGRSAPAEPPHAAAERAAGSRAAPGAAPSGAPEGAAEAASERGGRSMGSGDELATDHSLREEGGGTEAEEVEGGARMARQPARRPGQGAGERLSPDRRPPQERDTTGRSPSGAAEPARERTPRDRSRTNTRSPAPAREQQHGDVVVNPDSEQIAINNIIEQMAILREPFVGQERWLARAPLSLVEAWLNYLDALPAAQRRQIRNEAAFLRAKVEAGERPPKRKRRAATEKESGRRTCADCGYSHFVGGPGGVCAGIIKV